MENNSYATAIIVGIIVVIVIGGVYFFLSSQNASPTPTTSVPQETTPTIMPPTSTITPSTTSQPSPSSDQSQVKTFTVSAQNFSFSPSEIRVKKGDTVKIMLQSQGGMHDWVVDEFNARTQRISDGQTDQVEFTADKTGTFEFYCSVQNHRQMGMKGTFIVE